MNPIYDTLNERQLEAVMHTEGPLSVTAGAGSGKTKVLTCRIARLLEIGVEPYRILAITFTNKAAKEMRERVQTLVGAKAERIWLSTFHSFCARLLRFEIDGFAGYTHNFTIYDSADQISLVKGCLKDLNLDDRRNFRRAPCWGRYQPLKMRCLRRGNLPCRQMIFMPGRWPRCTAFMKRN
ncbi:hypothetical protein HMPREF0080_01006 [Anaeroglobus geminatus F0357]|uniref:UvrD-like helicase ATP-binding domain-containing protein n=1 Tax=Anaeroglobus geminatus F0357 TaxID=861450 RepID=G9YH79_9FIRM|nr:hypothetical protein HMPREF0080_01006 [Anaeroglobus geminatus F0357]